MHSYSPFSSPFVVSSCPAQSWYPHGNHSYLVDVAMLDVELRQAENIASGRETWNRKIDETEGAQVVGPPLIQLTERQLHNAYSN